jgi:hypothetical protein
MFSLGTCSGYLFAADVTEVVEEEAVVEEAPAGVETEGSTTAEAVPAEEPTGEGETPAVEEDGFWNGPWPWILGGAVVVGGGVGIAVAASGGGGGGDGDDGYNPVGTWALVFDWYCNGSVGYGIWYIREGGNFTDSDGSSGTWSKSGTTFRLTYSSTGTVYSGTMTSDNEMSGSMNDGGITGCWAAAKAVSGVTRAEIQVGQDGQTTINAAGVSH